MSTESDYETQEIRLTRVAALEAVGRELIDSKFLLKGCVSELSREIVKALGFK